MKKFKKIDPPYYAWASFGGLLPTCAGPLLAACCLYLCRASFGGLLPTCGGPLWACICLWLEIH